MKKLTLITITLFALLSCGSLVTTTLKEVPNTVVIDNKVNLGLLEYNYYAYPTNTNEFFLEGIIIKTWLPRFEAGDSCKIDFKRKNHYIVKKLK